MNFFFEFIGFPGSGKTYISKKIIRNLLMENINVLRNDEYFFNYYPKNKFDNFLFKKYYSYKVKKKFESKFLFKKKYFFLKKKIRFIIRKNNLNNILKKYELILNQTNLNAQGKRRSLENFQIDLCTYYLTESRFNKVIYNDEGMFQKVYQDYNYNLKFPNLKKKIVNYLNLVPSPNLVINVNTNFKLSLKRNLIRNEGFNYFKGNFKEAEKNLKQLDQLVKKTLRKKKIKVLNIKKGNLTKKNFLYIKKEILKNL